MLKIISINVNGIRSANIKGLFNWLQLINPDIICIQELKANLTDIPQELINWNDYYTKFHPAQKKGYSGVAIMSRHKPDNMLLKINNQEIDEEGRYIQFDFDNLSVVSLYLPSGSSGDDKQEKKFRFMKFYYPILLDQLKSGREYIICGDWNIAHQEIDLKNWKGNLKNSGFLPEERKWITDILNNGWVDGWRMLYPEDPGYTWWSNRGQAYSKNVGWRIDYHMLTPNIATKLQSAQVFKEIKFSDHAPLIMEYDINLK